MEPGSTSPEAPMTTHSFSAVIEAVRGYGPHAFGVIVVVVLWFVIARPELEAARAANGKVLLETAQVLNKTAETLERTSERLERMEERRAVLP